MVLHMREDQAKMGEEKKVKEIIKKHSQFIRYPIKLLCQKDKDQEITDNDGEDEKDNNNKPKI